jgi:exopolysaccharide biosynthesis polyprenyl glycosylphosphotransferase
MIEQRDRITSDARDGRLALRRRHRWAEAFGSISLGSHRRLWRDALLRRVLALADAVAAITVSLWLGLGPSGDLDVAFWAAVFLPMWLLLAKLHGLYDRDHRALRHLTVDELTSLLTWAMSGTVAITLLLALTPVGQPDVSRALQIWLVAASSAFVLRALARWLWRRITPPARTLVIGDGPLYEATHRKLELFRDIHVAVLPGPREPTLAALLASDGWLSGLDRVILACRVVDERLLAELIARCRREQVKLSVVPPARGLFGTAVQLSHVADLPVVEYNTWDVSRSTQLLKRAIDVAVSLVALIPLAPFFGLIALAVRLESRGPVFFSQTRVGLYGRQFRMLKFRTMVENAETLLPDLVPLDRLPDPMFKLRRDPRVTRTGRFLRRTSLDELPQLLNVLRGDMSLVGPRPEQVELVERYAPEHLFRLAVRPGLTGPMQVYGRGELTFEERLAVEREYIENLSLNRDLRILALTLSAVVGGHGAF